MNKTHTNRWNWPYTIVFVVTYVAARNAPWPRDNPWWSYAICGFIAGMTAGAVDMLYVRQFRKGRTR